MGGADLILCYWGMLEGAIDREPTKAISWGPIFGPVLPDETQYRHIRLKLAIIELKQERKLVHVRPRFLCR